MYQYDDPTCVATLPAPTATGAAGYFSNGNPTTGLGATVLTADYMNMVMLELLNVVKAGGISPSKTTYDQVLSAIKRIGQNTIVLADTGIANAYSAANPTALAASTWLDGVVQAVKIAHTNTGASTYSPDGLTAIPIYGLGLQPLQGGEMVVGGTAILMRTTIAGVNSGNPVCVLMEGAGGAQQTAAATALQHAPQSGQVQRNAFNYASVAGGTANALTATLVPAPASYTDDLTVVVRITSNNTGATTLNVNGLGVTAVVGAGHQPLQGGELAANGFACFTYSQALSQFILLWSTGGAEQVAAATQGQHAVQLQQVGNRVGEICFFAVSSPPAGFLAANGAAVSRTAYAMLFAAIGTTFGAGDGSATFNVPDMRGMFPRGWDSGAGVDSGRAFGSYQADSYASHNHAVSDPSHFHSVAAGGSLQSLGSGGMQYNVLSGSQNTSSSFTGISVQSSGGAATRGKNIALLACIKY